MEKKQAWSILCTQGECLIVLGDVPWPKMNIPVKLYYKLYDHQNNGVQQWLASLYSKGIGGIFGDDMGLGKITIVHD